MLAWVIIPFLYINGNAPVSDDVTKFLNVFSQDYHPLVVSALAVITIGNCNWGKSLLLLCLEESKLIGILCIRYCLTKELEKQYGNIGYSVRPSERNQGYATRMLLHGLKVCEENGMDRVILGCHSDNMASVSVIKKCRGSNAYSL